MNKIAIIGNGNHSKRIQFILKKKRKNFFIYKPIKKKEDKINFEKVKKCKIIFICSPNNTHFDYIKKLFKGRYIFCEKPPVSKKSELNKLKKINNKKIYFNFNQRFSILADLLKKINKYKLGDLVYANRICSHGLAFKKEYKKSWRSNILKCKKGVFEIVSIHDLDIVNFFFKIKKINKPKLINIQNKGTSFDTSLVNIETENSGNINIFSTYSSALHDEWIFMYENGIIKLVNESLTVNGPTNNFDKKGFFIKPKLIYRKKISKRDYENSLKKSISYFLNFVKKNKNITKKHFYKSVETNSLLF